jgi:phosphoglycerate dehydrogenase-like enzyme
LIFKKKPKEKMEPSTAKPRSLFILDERHWENVFGPLQRAELEPLVQLPARFHTRESILENPGDLEETEILFGSWGMPVIDEAFLKLAPKLKAIFYAAGSVRCFVTDAMWDRGIRVTSCNQAMGVTVAELALGQILLSLKAVWQQSAQLRRDQKWERQKFAGIYESTVGLVSLGAVARHLVGLLKNFNLRIIAYDPMMSPEKARAMGVELRSLDEVFSEADVVSIHTPWLPETERLIRGRHLESMRFNSTLINTSRGAVIAEDEMIEVLRRRPDLYALLDVTHPEPPDPASPLFTLPNVLLTPHLAGTIWSECRRLGRMTIDELERYRAGKPLQGEVTREMMAYIA